jgi:hypothetical protein
MFGMGCARCWDRDCSCTPKEMEEYYDRERIRRVEREELKNIAEEKAEKLKFLRCHQRK